MSLLNQALPNAKQLREAKGFGEVIVQYRGRHTGLPLQETDCSPRKCVGNSFYMQ